MRNALEKGIPCKGLHFCYADSLKDEETTFQTKTVSNMLVRKTEVIRFVGEIPEIVTSKQFLNTLLNLESRFSIKPKEDGWSVTLTRYVSMELGETVASWVEFPNGWYLHSDDADAEFTQDGAKTYLQRLKSVWMESPFWDSVKAMEEKPQ